MGLFNDVYNYLKSVPKGCVVTYGDIAKAIGRPHSAKAVGYALHNNPDPEHIPCYKVVNRYGELAKSFAFGGIEMQEALLEKDGVKVDGYAVDLKRYGYKGNHES